MSQKLKFFRYIWMSETKEKKEKDIVSETLPLWRSVYNRIREDLRTIVEHERSTIVDVPGNNLAPLKAALDFLLSLLTVAEPDQAISIRAPGAERSLVFCWFPWSVGDRAWIDKYAIFDHRRSSDQKIVWLPGGKDSDELRTMYRGLGLLGCSDALKNVLRTNSPSADNGYCSQYLWFWEG